MPAKAMRTSVLLCHINRRISAQMIAGLEFRARSAEACGFQPFERLGGFVDERGGAQ